MNIANHIRTIPDFPKPGVLFYDISTLLAHAAAWKMAVEMLRKTIAPHKPDLLAGIESRGFLVAAPLALELGCGFMMVRKKGKLPGGVIEHGYELEYGRDTVEIQDDAIESPGQRVVILDDLLATGGTMAAAVELIRKAGGDACATACIIELTFLNGRDKIDAPFSSLLQYRS